MLIYRDEVRAKYSSDDMKDLLAKGKAMKNASGDPSYPVADREDIEKAVQAVGRGSADHDSIRLHIIQGAHALNAMDLIPDNWDLSDGSLKDQKSRWIPPDTRDERRSASMSFGDIQSAVFSALVASIQPDQEWDIWVCDLGDDWVVYQRYDGKHPGLYQQAYTFDAGGSVVFAGDPVLVAQKTSFVPVQLNDGKPAGEHRKTVDGYQPQAYHADPDELVQCPKCKKMGDDDASYCDQCGFDLTSTGFVPRAYHADPDEVVTCPKCEKQNDVDASYCDQCGFELAGADGVTVESPKGKEKKSLRADDDPDGAKCPTCKGSGKIRDGNMTCPDCKGTGKAPAKETKSRIAGRRRPLVHQRRSLERMPEVRRVQTNFEVRASTDGSDIILAGTPIVYDTPYSVRDMFGSFRETMKPGVARSAMERPDFDCRFLFNHDGMPLARTASGTLVLTDTPSGLRAEAHLDVRSQLANDLAVAVERGDVSQMSCGFVVEDDEWRWGDDDMEERDIHSLDDLFDVSGVTYPASPTTDLVVAQRMLATAGQESRERIRRLFEVGAAVRSGSVLAQKDGEALRAAAEALYRLEGDGVPLAVQLDALRHANLALYGAFRKGKVLSAENQQDFEAALEALHSCDDIDIPEITKSLETIDKALDAGQAALSSVLGRVNPDGGPNDKNPTLVDAKDPASDKDARARQLAALELLRAQELLAS